MHAGQNGTSNLQVTSCQEFFQLSFTVHHTISYLRAPQCVTVHVIASGLALGPGPHASGPDHSLCRRMPYTWPGSQHMWKQLGSTYWGNTSSVPVMMSCTTLTVLWEGDRYTNNPWSLRLHIYCISDGAWRGVCSNMFKADPVFWCFNIQLWPEMTLAMAQSVQDLELIRSTVLE